jgi:hypothetical protein
MSAQRTHLVLCCYILFLPMFAVSIEVRDARTCLTCILSTVRLIADLNERERRHFFHSRIDQISHRHCVAYIYTDYVEDFAIVFLVAPQWLHLIASKSTSLLYRIRGRPISFFFWVNLHTPPHSLDSVRSSATRFVRMMCARCISICIRRADLKPDALPNRQWPNNYDEIRFFRILDYSFVTLMYEKCFVAFNAIFCHLCKASHQIIAIAIMKYWNINVDFRK